MCMLHLTLLTGIALLEIFEVDVYMDGYICRIILVNTVICFSCFIQ